MTNLLQNQNNNFGGDFSPPQQLRGETAKWGPGSHDTLISKEKHLKPVVPANRGQPPRFMPPTARSAW